MVFSGVIFRGSNYIHSGVPHTQKSQMLIENNHINNTRNSFQCALVEVLESETPIRIKSIHYRSLRQREYTHPASLFPLYTHFVRRGGGEAACAAWGRLVLR